VEEVLPPHHHGEERRFFFLPGRTIWHGFLNCLGKWKGPLEMFSPPIPLAPWKRFRTRVSQLFAVQVILHNIYFFFSPDLFQKRLRCFPPPSPRVPPLHFFLPPPMVFLFGVTRLGTLTPRSPLFPFVCGSERLQVPLYKLPLGSPPCGLRFPPVFFFWLPQPPHLSTGFFFLSFPPHEFRL